MKIQQISLRAYLWYDMIKICISFLYIRIVKIMLMLSEKYSAKLTGNPFLYTEIKEAAKLIQSGLSEKEIRIKAVEENIFNYKTIKSVPKRLHAIFERLNSIDDKLSEMLAKSPNEVGRLINLYGIMKTDTLFLEFMEEVVLECYKNHQVKLINSDILRFFDNKSEQDQIVKNFSESTLKKLKQVYINILIGAGYIKDKKTLEISVPVFYFELTNHLEVIGDKRYLRAMLGG